MKLQMVFWNHSVPKTKDKDLSIVYGNTIKQWIPTVILNLNLKVTMFIQTTCSPNMKFNNTAYNLISCFTFYGCIHDPNHRACSSLGKLTQQRGLRWGKLEDRKKQIFSITAETSAPATSSRCHPCSEVILEAQPHWASTGPVPQMTSQRDLSS